MSDADCDGCGLTIPPAAMPIHQAGHVYCSEWCLDDSNSR